MNGNSLLLDTNIVLYLLSGDKDLSDLLFNRKLYISFITQLELLGFSDLSKKQTKIINEFLSHCVIIDINNSIKENAIKIRQTKKVKLPDAIIMATSQYLNVPLITSDNGMTQIEEVDVILYAKDEEL